jgi:DNA-binding NarL/FixJ family response regulator
MVRKDTVLSPRERAVLQLVVDGKSTSEIATALKSTSKTIKTYVENIYDKAAEHLPIEEGTGWEHAHRRRQQLVEWGKVYLGRA